MCLIALFYELGQILLGTHKLLVQPLVAGYWLMINFLRFCGLLKDPRTSEHIPTQPAAASNMQTIAPAALCRKDPCKELVHCFG